MIGGDLVRVWCGAFWHYGVAVDQDDIVHFHHNKPRDAAMGIRRVPRASFEAVGSVSLESVPVDDCLSREVAVSRAYRSIEDGFGRYDLLTNNCEHFARWCVSGRKESLQVLVPVEHIGRIVRTFKKIRPKKLMARLLGHI